MNCNLQPAEIRLLLSKIIVDIFEIESNIDYLQRSFFDGLSVTLISDISDCSIRSHGTGELFYWIRIGYVRSRIK